MEHLVECVPNFSEGRRPEVYNAIADAIRSAPGTHVLDVSADADHNRTVITFVGSPEAVQEGAYRAISVAAQHIDLNEHEGEHPRIGATDVCPLIPVRGIDVDECVEIARKLAKRVADGLGIAVYLYGAAAVRPERRKLADIRRGQYEKWREEVSTEPDRMPDFGPAEPKPWGATVIGVRPFLIAYNLYLNSDDVEVANQIARSVRFSSGGLRFVQAMGFLVEGQAQVSMNLTDFNRTPIHRVQELVRTEAARHGLAITKAELIGLAPEKALIEAARWYLQIDDLRDEQILEIRLAQEETADFTPYSFLEATASGTPTPGGGSTAALAGSLGAALTQMVANLTIGRSKYAAVQMETEEVLRQSVTLQQDLTAAIAEDSAAFDHLMAAWKDKSLDDQTRAEAVEQATIRAGEVPMQVARLSRDVADLALEITRIGNSNALTDAAAGGIMAKAAVQIAAMNVKINARGLQDRALAEAWLEELEELEAGVNEVTKATRTLASERGGI